jgi:hypothetical protein
MIPPLPGGTKSTNSMRKTKSQSLNTSKNLLKNKNA